MRFIRWFTLSLLVSVLLAACNRTAAPPIIDSFSADPTVLSAGGGTVTLKWAVENAESLSLSGVGDVSTEADNTLEVQVTQTTTFTLTATNNAGSATATATATVEALAPGTQSEVATGFNGPMGSVVDEQGNLWVVDSGTGGDTEVVPGITYGETARIVKVAPDGTQTEVATLPSLGTPDGNSGGNRLAFLDGTLYATSAEALGDPSATFPFFVGVVKLEGKTVTLVGDTWAFEAGENPDGLPNDANTDGIHSHPYGLAVGADGALYAVQIAEPDFTPGSGRIVRVEPGGSEVVVTGLMYPSSLSFDPAGDAYVTTNVTGASGSGSLLKIAALTRLGAAQTGQGAARAPSLPAHTPSFGTLFR